MTTHAEIEQRTVDPLEVFTLRCQAQALLVELGELALHDAVDGLQSDAERDGLADLIGQDRVQEILAAAFVRQR